MQQVITEQQAREITGGRKPLVPVEYEQAVTALQACLTIDEAKYWSDKSDALAAWAKIHADDKAGRKARALKLHAYRRMGDLAREIRGDGAKGLGLGKGRKPGAFKLLRAHGLPKSHAQAALNISRMPEDQFGSAIGAVRPPTPRFLSQQHSFTGSESWRLMHVPGGPATFRSFCRREDAQKLARSLRADEVQKARGLFTEITEWLDAFEQALPKAKET